MTQDGRYLICRRLASAHFGGWWEFPGGKREPGESLADCLRRELREELGVEVSAPEPVIVITHEYPERAVELHFFSCTLTRGEPAALGCQEWRWAFPGELDSGEFPPADRPVVERLKDGFP